MNDYTYTDFLIKKSVQPFSLRNLHGAVNQNQNLTLHLNKKAAQLRQDEGQQMNAMKIIESKKLLVITLPNTDRYLKQITHPKDVKWTDLMKNSENKKMMQLMNQDKYTDDCVVVSEGSKITHTNVTVQQKQLEKLKKQKNIWTIENKLKFVMADKINFQDIKEMNKTFLTEKLKRNFWDLRLQNVESTPQSSRDYSVKNEGCERKQTPKSEEYFQLLRDKLIDIGRMNTLTTQNINIKPSQNTNIINSQKMENKESCHVERSECNSQFSTSQVTLFESIEKMNERNRLGKNQNTNNDLSLQKSESRKQQFIETEQFSSPQRMQIQQITPITSEKVLEGKTQIQDKDKLQIGGIIDYTLDNDVDQFTQSAEVNGQESIHAHFKDFKAEQIKRKNYQAIKQSQSQKQLINNKINHISKDSCLNLEQNLSCGFHQGGVSTELNIIPFDSQIFISNNELETERKWRNVNPGENYEQLRFITEEKEKLLIDFVCKKNKFQLIDLVPKNLKTRNYRYLQGDSIQLTDFDQAAYLKQQKRKDKVKTNSTDLNKQKEYLTESIKQSINKNGSQTDRASTKIKSNSQSSRLQIPFADQIIENEQQQDFPQTQNEVRKKKKKMNKKKSSCFLRLGKNTDENSIYYLKKYGLEETINLKDGYEKFRQTGVTAVPTATTTQSLKSNKHRYSFSSNSDNNNLQKGRSTLSQPKYDPYQMNSNNQFVKPNILVAHTKNNLSQIDTNQQIRLNQYDKNSMNHTLASPNKTSKYTVDGQQRDHNINITQSVSRNSYQNKGFGVHKLQKENQIGSLNNSKHEKQIDLQSINQHDLNCLFSPLKNQIKYSSRHIFSQEKTNLNSPYISRIIGGQEDITLSNADDVKTAKKLSKSVQRINEKQNNIKQNFQLKEDFITFYDNIITTSKQQTSQSNRINRKINSMIKKVDKNLASIEHQEGPKVSTLSHEFKDFKEMKIFKRKLFNYAVNKMHPDDRRSLFDFYSMTHRKEVEEIFSQQMQK